MDGNANCGKFFKNLSKTFKKFLRKMRKTHYFSMFSKNFINYSFVFRGFGRKTQFLKVLRKFSKVFLRKSLKMHYFCIFLKNSNKSFVNFLGVWTKNPNFWEILRKFWKFLMKILLKNWIFILFFILFFENLLLKIEPSEITPVFYNNFSVSGGNFPPFPPWLRPWLSGISCYGIIFSLNFTLLELLILTWGGYSVDLIYTVLSKIWSNSENEKLQWKYLYKFDLFRE